jgi:hypothetical protein
MTTTHLSRISRGLHGANINGHLVLVAGHKGEWVVSVDGETLGTCESLVDAEVTAELHVMVTA